MKKIIGIICFIIVILGSVFWIKKIPKKDNSFIDKKDEFIINKIHYYSSANAMSNTTNYQNPEWNLKIYQYTDIAMYIDRINSISNDNYIKELSIVNIKTNSDNQQVYYLNPTLFGNNQLQLDNILGDNKKLEYNIINTDNKDNSQNYNIPIFYEDCSNPITLRMVNVLAENYKVLNDTPLIYNGSLINKIGYDIKKLNSNLSFELELITKNGEKKNKKIDLIIPFEKNGSSILDGDINIEEKCSIKF